MKFFQHEILVDGSSCSVVIDWAKLESLAKQALLNGRRVASGPVSVTPTVQESSGNIFRDLGFTPREAAALQAASMRTIRKRKRKR